MKEPLSEIKQDYLGTDNAKFLRSILERQILNWGLSDKDNKNNNYLRSITRDNNGPRDIIAKAIDWYLNSIKEYVDIMGALSKGELKAVSSSLFNIQEWRLNDYILERRIKNKGSLKIKELLLEDKVKYEQLYRLVERLDLLPGEIGYKFAYRKVAEGKNIIWFKDIDKALKYINGFLVVTVEKKDFKKIKKKKIKKEIKKKEIIIPKRHLDNPSGKPLSSLDFATEHHLGEKSSKGKFIGY